MTTAPIVHAAPQKCFRRLVGGEVKRCFARGPLIGYWICCPRCSRTFQYLSGITESVGWTSGEYRWIDDSGAEDVERSAVVARPSEIAGELRCFGCGGRMTVGGGEVACRAVEDIQAT